MAESSDINVFISYGRRDATAFVDKLATDLKNAGFSVWRDIEDLRSPNPWEDQLAAALKKCDAVVAVLTPHAVRTGREPSSDGNESVCLDELAFARFSPPPTPIIPLLLTPCEPPFVIFRLNYLDFLKSDADEGRYKIAFDRLLKTIRDVKSGEAPPYRATAFEPLDFDTYLRAKTRDFVGREWLIAEVLDFLKKPDSPPALVLVGAPGWGKTAFAGHLFSANPEGQLLAAHFCRADRADSIDPRRFIENLVAMTAMRVPAFETSIRNQVSKFEELLRKAPIKDAFEQMFLEPLAALDPTTLGTLPRYLLVDSLDEAASSPATPSIDALLAQTVGLFPDWLRLIATSRDKAGVIDAFGNATIHRLNSDDERNQRDIQMLITRRLEPPVSSDGQGDKSTPPVPARLLEIIAAKAEGNALCATQLAQVVRRSGMDATSIATLPPGLSALYREILQRRFPPGNAEWPQVREILEMILATKAALPIELAAMARGDEAQYETRQAIERISDLLNVHDDTLRLFHLTLIEFLGLPGSPFFVNASQGAARLAGLTFNTERRAKMSPPIKAFCVMNSESWLLQCIDPGSYAKDLVSFYDEVCFSRPAGQFSMYVNGVEIGEEDVRLIGHLARTGHTQVVLDIIALGFTRALDRFKQSEAGRFADDINNSRPMPTDKDWRRKLGRELEVSFRNACFALGWMRELAKIKPEVKPQLRQISAAHRTIKAAFSWINGIGYHTLGISGYFEDQAYAIILDWGDIDKELV